MDQTFMEKKPIVPLVVKMSLPIVVSMIITALYNIVDSYFVAKISEDAMTALSLVFPLQNITNAAGIGFGVGVNAAVSFYMGARRNDSASRSAVLGIIYSILHGIILGLICIFSIKPFLSFFTDNSVITKYGLDYFYIVMAFSPALTLSMCLEKIIQSTGKMKTTMICMLVGAVSNIILDPIFIFGYLGMPTMGVKGAALATGIGQVLSLISYYVVFRKVKLPVKLKLGHKNEDKITYRLYLVGIPATLNLALPSFMITALNSILSAFSTSYVLILGVYYKLQTFIYFSISGIVQGIRPLVGYNYGARKKNRVMVIFKVTLLASIFIMIIGTILCMVIPDKLIDLFTDNSETIVLGKTCLRIISLGFIISALSVVISGVFEGLGMGISSLIISLIRYLLIIFVAFIMSKLIGVKGVWWSFPITEVIASLVSVIIFLKSFVLKNDDIEDIEL